MAQQYAIVYQMCSTCFKGNPTYEKFREHLIDLLENGKFHSTKNQTVFISEPGLENPRQVAETIAATIHKEDPKCKYLKRLDYFLVEDNFNLLDPHCPCAGSDSEDCDD